MPKRTDGHAPAEGPLVPDRLRKVYVEPTNACNLNCRTCVRHAWTEAEGFMDWEVYEAIVNGLAAFTAEAGDDRPFATIALMGLGEPLLHPRFLDMVRLAKERGLRVEVTTNALLLDEKLAGGLLAAGLDQLVVSIDGTSAETFGQVRSGASLEKVVRNVGRLHRQRSVSYEPSTRIGIEFVAMRGNVDELPGLNRLAARLGASFVIVSNVLAYTPELVAETLYDRSATTYGGESTSVSPHWHLPKLDWDERVGASLGRALKTAGGVSLLDQSTEVANNRCPFVHTDACAVAWHGGVSPCPPLLHTYTCYVQQRQKLMTRWEVGRLPTASLATIWAKPDYVAFRDRVRRFDFPPCTDCSCDLAEGNLEDCFGDPHPVCGDCLWARGIIRCA